MSQEETKEYFNLERKKHFDFFLPYYIDRNWLVIEDNINSERPMDWDVKLEVSVGKIILVDEKVRKGEFSDFLLEVIQDLKSEKLGWLFGKKDFILYGSWEDIDNICPSSLYIVDMNKLKEYLYNLNGFIKTCISAKGWGITWNIILDWEELINRKIAKKLR